MGGVQNRGGTARARVAGIGTGRSSCGSCSGHNANGVPVEYAQSQC